MARSRGLVVLAIFCALLVPALALLTAKGLTDWPDAAAVAPFGWHRLIVVHVLAAQLLSWVLAGFVCRRFAGGGNRGWAVFMVLAGIGMALISSAGGRLLEVPLNSLEAGYTSRMLVRILWCVGLQFPWCVAGYMVAGGLDAQRGLWRPSTSLMLLATVVAVGVPASFLSVFLDEQAIRAREAWQQSKLIDAAKLVHRLYDVGSNASLGTRNAMVAGRPTEQQVTPAQALADLRQAVQFVGERIAAAVYAPPGDQRQLQLARDHLSLNQVDEAAAVLQPVAQRQPVAALMLARLESERGDDAACQSWAQAALRMAREVRTDDAAQNRANEDLQLWAIDMLVATAGEQQDFAAAERYLLEAFDNLPERHAEIHDRLARHYEFLGELKQSLHHQRQAALLDPAAFSEPENLARKILSSGAPIGLARPKASRYK